MNALESPLEALAFDYLSFGIFTAVSNLWTWVAVITAAVSFWRIKKAGAAALSYSTQTQPHLHRPPNYPITTHSQSPPVPATSPAQSVLQTPPATSSAPASTTVPRAPSVEDVDGETKGKFVLYYQNEETESDGELTVVQEWEDEDRDGCEEWWETVMRVRRVDMNMAWHSHQDLTVINGNIVRFWDEFNPRERRHSSACAVW